MAETNTPNYNLIKPDPLDFYDVRKFNENADLIDAELKNINDNDAAHKADKANPHAVTKLQVGLPDVDNVKQMPHVGGTFNGIAKALPNTSYAVAQLRNITLSTGDPVGGSDGDIWIKYT